MNTNNPANEQGLLPDPLPTTTHTEEPASTAAPTPRQRRGFATMDREKVREIARHGGKAAHAAGTAHEFTSDEAREAGRKGGLATHAKRRSKNDAADSPPRQ
ncbi:MAG TPA: general stress protein [Polyangiaceae bacterium]